MSGTGSVIIIIAASPSSVTLSSSPVHWRVCVECIEPIHAAADPICKSKPILLYGSLYHFPHRVLSLLSQHTFKLQYAAFLQCRSPSPILSLASPSVCAASCQTALTLQRIHQTIPRCTTTAVNCLMCSGAAAAAGTKRSHRALTEGRGSSGLKIISVADRGKREHDLIMAKVFIFTRCRLDASQPRVYPNAVGGFRGMGRSAAWCCLMDYSVPGLLTFCSASVAMNWKVLR